MKVFLKNHALYTTFSLKKICPLDFIGNDDEREYHYTESSLTPPSPNQHSFHVVKKTVIIPNERNTNLNYKNKLTLNIFF